MPVPFKTNNGRGKVQPCLPLSFPVERASKTFCLLPRGRAWTRIQLILGITGRLAVILSAQLLSSDFQKNGRWVRCFCRFDSPNQCDCRWTDFSLIFVVFYLLLLIRTYWDSALKYLFIRSDLFMFIVSDDESQKSTMTIFVIFDSNPWWNYGEILSSQFQPN